MGWSYGGYMTSWVITQTKRFKAASVGAGVTNLASFTGTADIPGFIPDYFGGEHWDVLDKWRARSAMFNVKGVSTPTLIQHGEEDRRAPVSQGYELYNALRQRVPVKMIVYPRQPHGIQEPKLIKDTMERNLEWFDKWILGRGRRQRRNESDDARFEVQGAGFKVGFRVRGSGWFTFRFGVGSRFARSSRTRTSNRSFISRTGFHP